MPAPWPSFLPSSSWSDGLALPTLGGLLVLGVFVLNVVTAMNVAEPFGVPYAVWAGAVAFLGVLFLVFGLG